MNAWKAVKVSDSPQEYHVLEYAPGGNPDKPYILAKCSGPVPAGEIVRAMYVVQEMEQVKGRVSSAIYSLQEVNRQIEEKISWKNVPNENHKG